MLYASCKASFVSALGNFGIPVENLLSIEIDGPSEVSQQALISHLHPQTEVKKVFYVYFYCFIASVVCIN